MIFVVQIVVPYRRGCFNTCPGEPVAAYVARRLAWEGTNHLPTLQIEAPTRGDAQARMRDVVSHMPEGTTFDLVAV